MVMSGQQEMYNHARDFREKVSNCIDSSEEAMNFYQALKSYNSVRNVDKLIADLLPIINTPKRHILFDEVGSLVAVDDYDDFMSKIPLPPSEGIRIVKIRRVATESLGFGIRGGKEHGVGVYISSVIRGSRSDIAGLKPGDEILLINGFMITESTHSEVVNLMRTRRNLRLKVRSARKYPERVNGNLIWNTLDGKENVFRYNPGVLNHIVSQLTLVRSQSPVLHMRETDKQVKFIVGPQGLGCSVRNGIPTKYGVFVIHVTQGSLAERVGVMVGDQIMMLNKKNFSNIKYSEAVQLLKTTKEFDMILRPCKEAKEFVEFSRSKGFAIVSASNPSSPTKKPADTEPVTVEPDVNPRPVPTTASAPVFNSDDERTTSAHIYSKVKKKRSSKKDQSQQNEPTQRNNPPENIAFNEKTLSGREPKSVVVSKSEMHILILDEIEGRIVVRDNGGLSGGNIHTGDLLLCIGNVSLAGLSLSQAKSVLDDTLKRDEENISVVIGVTPDRNRNNASPVSSNWSFAQKDLSNIDEKDLVYTH
ncbi:harmonin-like isoform X2 [Dendronephthya gigantea]|uniref:harmonin-like isoform X2 n=1 Tax=Dendronephthya gigantea TaxID=151771 RepID=UPI00106B78EE|nr:harmonin-like isoform X2 [Dendronephthya gigantea]